MQHILWALLSCSYSSKPQDLHGSDPEKHRPSEAQMLASGICVPHVHPGTWTLAHGRYGAVLQIPSTPGIPIEQGEQQGQRCWGLTGSRE